MNDFLLTPRHQVVVKALGCALTLEMDITAMLTLARTMRRSLAPLELSSVAAIALSATDDEHFFEIVEALVPERMAGSPLPPLLDPMNEAIWWANMASPAEIEAYLAAAFSRLTPQEKRAFLDAAERRLAK